MPKGRPRQFTTEEALESATRVFWEKGYRGTSLDDLTAAMGINRPSLYATFGDKENLFLSAVDHYRTTYIKPKVAKLLEASSLRSGLTDFFAGMASVISTPDRSRPPGCLIACLLSEECCESEVIRNKLRELISGADDVFAMVFDKHKNELNEHLSAKSAACLLTSTIHGVSTRARAGADIDELRQIAETFITLVVKPSC